MEYFATFTTEKASSVGTAIYGIIAAIAFFRALYEYRKSQNWKRLEFVAVEMKEFKSQTAIRNVIQMLDYNSRPIELFPEETDPAKRYYTYTDKDICAALAVHDTEGTHTSGSFTKAQLAIRDSFDLYLEGYERFYSFIEADLVTEKEFEPYLTYDIAIMMGKGSRSNKKTDVTLALKNFITGYQYTGVEELFKLYKNEIDNNSPNRPYRPKK